MRILLVVLALIGGLLALLGRNAAPPAWKLPLPEVHPTLSQDGSLLAYENKVINLRSHEVTPLPEGSHLFLAAGGTHVAFCSEASNLVPDDRDSAQDVFVCDLVKKTIVRMVPPRERYGECSSFWPSLSPDGRLVGYSSFGVEGEERRFVLQGALLPLDPSAYGRLAFSPDGTRVAGACALAPGRMHIEVCEVKGGPVVRLTAGADGPSHGPVLSIRQCVFASLATNLAPGAVSGVYNILSHDLETGRFAVLTPGADDACLEPSVSADGSLVAYCSYATNLAPGTATHESRVYACVEGRTRLLSRGLQASYNPCVSQDGSTVAFACRDGGVYVWKRETDALQRY